jgi:hypothetical protein
MKICKTTTFITKAKKIHGDTYNYSETEYVHVMDKVKILCSIHGIFEITANKHLNGRGCNICGNIRTADSKLSNVNEFINKANKVHNYIYEYNLVKYKKSSIKVKINCKTHGIFECTPNNHLSGKGCPMCRLSKGEIRVKNFLDIHKINYNTQYRFLNCKNIRPLPFDFYLPDHNICIEYDGKQHYIKDCWSLDKIKNETRYKQTQLTDKIKDEYCKDNNIHLIRISYLKFDEIENILKDLII